MLEKGQTQSRREVRLEPTSFTAFRQLSIRLVCIFVTGLNDPSETITTGVLPFATWLRGAVGALLERASVHSGDPED